MSTNTKDTITAKLVISDETIRGLLCCAFEGGSDYWCTNRVGHTPKGTTMSDFHPGGKHSAPEGTYWHWSQTIPLMPGGIVAIVDHDDAGRILRLGRAAIKRGIQTMAAHYPRHFAAVLSEAADATTGDVFLQCCLFGEVRYS